MFLSEYSLDTADSSTLLRKFISGLSRHWPLESFETLMKSSAGQDIRFEMNGKMLLKCLEQFSAAEVKKFKMAESSKLS